MKLCVFPNDPIINYYNKGEIKERYFNPNDFFDEVHIITFIENDVEESKVQIIAGKAELKIHSLGKVKLKDRKKNLERVFNLVSDIKPDVIRAYNPLLEGWFAASCSQRLQIPFYLSLHTQYDYNRKLAKSNLKKFFALKYTEKLIEPFVLKSANKITSVYKIIEPYVLKHSSKKPEILHNKVNCKQFSKASSVDSLPTPLIITVGSLIQVKNHQCLIEAMKGIDANLLIIGNGELYEELIRLIKKHDLQDKITIIKFVPNNQIQNYYKSAKFFALAYNPEVEGLPMPVMEAMASGLPVIIPYPKKGFSEGLEDVAIFSKRTPKAYSKNFEQLLNNSKLREEYSQKSFCKAKDFDSETIESREAQIYAELVEKKGLDTLEENFT